MTLALTMEHTILDAAGCRPHDLGLFGAGDPIGAGYRAYKVYGPIYG